METSEFSSCHENFCTIYSRCAFLFRIEDLACAPYLVTFACPSPFSSIMADIKPNHTIYINNLNEKVKKEGESPFMPLVSSVSPLQN